MTKLFVHVGESMVEATGTFAAYQPQFVALADFERVNDALDRLVTRCDGAEGVRADGSNIDTLEAHAALLNLKEQMT